MSQPDTARDGAVRLAARLEPRVNHLARVIVERQRAEIPGFDLLPDEMRDVEIAATARHALRGFLRHVRGLPDIDIGVFRERAAERAEEGLPLVQLLRGYHVGAEVVLDTLSELARPGEQAALQALTRIQLRALQAVVENVTEAYLTGLADQQGPARELARALVRGDAPAEVAARYGLSLESGYLVLSVRTLAPQTPLAARRLLRWALARLAPLAEGRVLGLPEEGGGCVLLPSRIAPDAVAEQLSSCRTTAPIVGAATADSPDGVPAAADRARRIAAVAAAPGVHRLRDVLLEYHVAAATDSAPELGALLEPLVRRPGLTATVAAFLDCDFDRRRTAQALDVHPNTVDNRLSRVTELTGVDPRTARGVQLLGAALTLHRMAPPGPPQAVAARPRDATSPSDTHARAPGRSTPVPPDLHSSAPGTTGSGGSRA
ncbi:PucR family transcriptional regulator [Streptomyces sp. IBSBF 3136]|uniref:PucR family transcriptional regulator n=1 Tax=Streptomyces sp. IBSBF 3136 TaxID=2903524 RepID=UPI002FDBA484